MVYTSHWSRFELTTSVVIGTDCRGSCKSNYHTITATTARIEFSTDTTKHHNSKANKAKQNTDLIWFIVFNATFSNISATSWRPVLVVEEAGVLGENHRPWASIWSTLSLAAASWVRRIGDRLEWVVRYSNYLTNWATRALKLPN